ncbi:hypothetical protein SNOG_05046 [Parastagonospora nodorum SN15]|uniref:Uncharacterized protein n=1 Tax=Phaeosphaeria nodorum (strain SN15 / ATCC MYA-4574 / FGSC 10173) TaxID=321614 RepID=Q0UT68_PHANO|nr:hypothetical protein SNOG_05046 [Parastagonospora nodorum SN15]EAT87437.1 hypothetical protein SNOG_05046 [Parastagonospora nodorum SN15]
MAAKCIIDSRTCLSHETQPPTNLLGTSSGRSTAMRSRPSTLSAPIIVAPLDSQLLQARRRNSRTVRRGTVSLYTGVIAAHRPGRFFLAAIQKAATPNRHGFATKKGRWEANCMMGSTLSFPTHTREPVPGGVAPPNNAPPPLHQRLQGLSVLASHVCTLIAHSTQLAKFGASGPFTLGFPASVTARNE